MHRSHHSYAVGLAILIGLTGCQESPTEPGITAVSVPGTFELQRARPSGAPLSGTAHFSGLSGEDLFPLISMRTPGLTYDEVSIFPNIFSSEIRGPIPTGARRFGMLGGDRGWTLQHKPHSSPESGDRIAFATSGFLEVTESGEFAVRGTLDVTFTYFADGRPVSQRVRGSFWATPAPGQ